MYISQSGKRNNFLTREKNASSNQMTQRWRDSKFTHGRNFNAFGFDFMIMWYYLTVYWILFALWINRILSTQDCTIICISWSYLACNELFINYEFIWFTTKERQTSKMRSYNLPAVYSITYTYFNERKKLSKHTTNLGMRSAC